MKNPSMRLFLSVCLCLMTLSQVLQAEQSPNTLTWPRTLKLDKQTFTFYQPQIESLKKNQLRYLMAISITDSGKKTHYGSIKGQCRLDIDKTQGIAICNDVILQSLNFPNIDSRQLQWLKALNHHVSSKSFALSLARISTNMEVKKLSALHAQADFKFTPPKIYLALMPTALISIDGKPQMRPISGSSLMRVVNTPFVIVLDVKTGWYYLQAGKQWMQTKSLEGHWTKSQALPAEVKKLDKKQGDSKQTEEGKPIENIIVSTKPAALLQIDGDPEYSPIEGTTLLYISNSQDDIFLQIKTQKYYALVSGRWYSSDTLSAKSVWTYVSPDGIPQAFATIPAASKKAGVLSSVPGTGAADEAVIKNHIPQTAVVKRSEAKLSVKYDGKPLFVQIPNTAVYYARNTDKAVFRINQRYFANYQGIWFVSSSPQGPWVVASDVPKAIYTIPPSSPHYNVTYSYVYGATPEYVYVGYTPGYTGSYVYQNTVIYGTGYYYPGWTGAVYYGYPVTWGFNFYYHPYAGWYPTAPYARPLWFGAGVAVGIAASNHWNHWNDGWFGPKRYYGYRGGNQVNINIHNTRNVYNHWGKNTVIRRNTIQHHDIFRQQRHVRHQPVVKHPRKVERARHPVSHATTRHQAHRDRVRHEVKQQRHHQTRRRNNVYAGRDGHVYRHHQGQWQKSTTRGWQPQQKHRQSNYLNKQRQYRERGNRHYQREHNYRQSFRQRPSEGFRPRSGGFHGGRRF